jgi:tRNA nucleotidyltransferase/poly(A) polymerase
MAKIEKKTIDSIIKNGHLIDTLSRERIWEEIKKSWYQSKDFNVYLKYLSDFNLMQYIFPGSNINTNLVDSKDFIVVISNLFKNENTSGLANRLIQDYKIESDVANKVVFLINFLKFNIELVFDFYKKKQQCDISNNTILEWLRVQNINDDASIKFVEYLPSVSSQDLISQGFSGRELGMKIKELEIKKFKEIISQ